LPDLDGYTVTKRNAERLHLAVALNGTGWHPAAWREPGARPADLLTAGYWADLVTEAERGGIDFVTFEDGLSLQSADRRAPDVRTDQVRGRLDAVLIASRVAPLTSRIGLIPTVVVTHTEPFHISKAIATLDWVSSGRAGVRVRVSARPDVRAAAAVCRTTRRGCCFRR
jgi:alkanesulfonate monooxygenase SsuD/methylene tetrahydromethanopterin reductase-like flavin-dependent oxidoreductase (luciferase family)